MADVQPPPPPQQPPPAPSAPSVAPPTGPRNRASTPTGPRAKTPTGPRARTPTGPRAKTPTGPRAKREQPQEVVVVGDSSKSPEKPASGRVRRKERRRAALKDKEQENGKDSTGKAKAADDAVPVASGSSTPYAPIEEAKATSSPAKVDATRTFAEGDDFIPFTFSDHSDDERPSSSRAGKGKDRETADDTKPSDRAKEKSRMRDEPSDRDRGSRRSGRDERDRERDRDRDRDDRDDERAGRKRKYDEYDDGYANKKERMDAASRKSPWIHNVDLGKCRNVAEMMHKEVESFLDWISPTAVEDEVRGLIVSQIEKVVTTTFPDALVYPFGSYQTKLYLPLGDIDLVILSDSMAYSDKSTVLYALANTLKRNGITSQVTIIAKAKVPIVKFTTTHGRFKVDISINQANGLVSGSIITGFLQHLIPNANERGESKALRALVMVTKAFLSQRSMNEVYTGGLGSYAIVCLAVSFLQMHPKIRRGEIDPEQNLGVLVMEFFELYGNHFNYDEVGISLRDGGTYFNKRQRGWYAEYKRNMLSIEDPADPSNDISSGSYNFHKVRTAFAGCHGILSSTAYLRAGILSSRQHGRSVSLRGHYEADDMSILATVMGITQETLNHRKMVQELYDKQILHRIVGVKPQAHVDKGGKKGKAEVVNGNGVEGRGDAGSSSQSSNSKTQASKAAVESAWNDHLDERGHDSHRGSGEHSFDNDEGGRYDIGRQPMKKRRKTGRADDAHTVYFEEDEDTEDGGHRAYAAQDDDSSASDSDVEVLHITGAHAREKDKSAKPPSEKSSNRRAYWLAKSDGNGMDGEDSMKTS